VTDIHFNFLDRETRRVFLHSLAAKADAVAVSGDIAESRDIEQQLAEIEDVLQRPVYFVLGNHDFYHGSIAGTREAVRRQSAKSQHLVYLTTAGIVELTPHTAVIGHDDWADARFGDFDNSWVILNDYVLIEELCKWQGPGVLDKPGLREVQRVFQLA
jgi:predicted MPP superfamily phosphohydrolase